MSSPPRRRVGAEQGQELVLPLPSSPGVGASLTEQDRPLKPAANRVDLSIIIPCYNQGEFLLDAIASIEASSLAGVGHEVTHEVIHEVIIVNDGSTEPLTIALLDSVARSGYRIVHQANRGLAAARNAGMAIARGEFFLPLDADNKVRSPYLGPAVALLRHCPEIGIVHGWAEWFGDRTGLWRIPEFDRVAMQEENWIDACAVFRRQVWQDCGGYDENLRCLEDWEFWLNAAAHGWRFHRLMEVCFDYRVRSGSLSDWRGNADRYWQAADYIQAKHACQTKPRDCEGRDQY